MSEFLDELKVNRQRAEGFYVASIVNDLDLLEEYKLENSHFDKKSPWVFYFSLISNMVKRKYEAIDHLSMDSFVDEFLSEKAKENYQRFGGYNTIELMSDIVDERNIEEYYENVLRYNALINVSNCGLDIEKHWASLKNLNYEEVSDYFETMISDVFTDITMGSDKVVDIKDGMWDMVVDADKGANRGLPVYSKLLDSVTNGQILGNITMLAGSSGVGKSYLTIALTLPKMIEHREPVVIMANEEELGRWQMQLLVWVAHNVIAREEGNKHLEITKNRFLKGKFTPDIWEILEKSQAWINKHVADGLINFVNFTSFTMDRVIGVVKRYTARFDIKYFILDTLKLDNDVGSNNDGAQSWLLLQQNMVKLYNVIKASNRNAHIWVTYQLSKEPRRYLSQNSLGISKNVADVVSTLILIRNVFETEKEGKTGLKIHDAKGSLKTLDPDKDYMVLFLDKNRAGPTSKQIVLETDKDRNVIRDVGFTIISEDF